MLILYSEGRGEAVIRLYCREECLDFLCSRVVKVGSGYNNTDAKLDEEMAAGVVTCDILVYVSRKC